MALPGPPPPRQVLMQLWQPLVVAETIGQNIHSNFDGVALVLNLQPMNPQPSCGPRTHLARCP